MTYLFTVVGFGMFIWPPILHHQDAWELMEGVVNCMMIAFWTPALLGTQARRDSLSKRQRGRPGIQGPG
ncbi:hypothetical protein [Deinococcus hopiensis]|uniref:hypothetical protein n=1 Tax=Deinococcus hopiensis TaxID=309885 RepID=UPI000A02B8FC|nr:hypothetical protein [Deinococcus hopiensis]